MIVVLPVWCHYDALCINHNDPYHSYKWPVEIILGLIDTPFCIFGFIWYLYRFPNPRLINDSGYRLYYALTRASALFLIYLFFQLVVWRH